MLFPKLATPCVIAVDIERNKEWGEKEYERIQS